MVDCFNKEIECLDEKGESRVLYEKRKHTSVRLITIMQAIYWNIKGCTLFAMKISRDEKAYSENKDEEKELLKKYLILQ